MYLELWNKKKLEEFVKLRLKMNANFCDLGNRNNLQTNYVWFQAGTVMVVEKNVALKNYHVMLEKELVTMIINVRELSFVAKRIALEVIFGQKIIVVLRRLRRIYDVILLTRGHRCIYNFGAHNFSEFSFTNCFF